MWNEPPVYSGWIRELMVVDRVISLLVNLVLLNVQIQLVG